MRQRKWVSVLTPAASSGEIDFIYTTVGSAQNITLLIPATGIIAGDSENVVAQKIYNCMYNVLLNTVMYGDVSQSAGQGLSGSSQFNVNNMQNGVLAIPPGGLVAGNGIFNIPVYGSQSPSSQARPAVTDHVVSLFSQAQFSLLASSNTVGATIHISTTPIYCTLSEARQRGPLRRQYWRLNDGTSMTDDQVIEVLEAACGDWINISNNYITQTCCVAERDGNLTDGIQLMKYPIVVTDTPRVRRPSILQTLVADTTTIDILSKYIVNRDTGWLTFRFAQNLVFNYEPFDFYNEIKVSYVGGYMSIPHEVKMLVLDISTFSGPPRQESELKSGTTSAKFYLPNVMYKDICNRYKSYMRSWTE